MRACVRACVGERERERERAIEYRTNRYQRTCALIHRSPTATAPSFLCKRFRNADGSHGARVCPTFWPQPVTPQVSSSVISAANQHSGLAQFVVLAPEMLRSFVFLFFFLARLSVLCLVIISLRFMHCAACTSTKFLTHTHTHTHTTALIFCLVLCFHSALATKTRSYCWTRLPSLSPLCKVSERTHAPTQITIHQPILTKYLHEMTNHFCPPLPGPHS